MSDRITKFRSSVAGLALRVSLGVIIAWHGYLKFTILQQFPNQGWQAPNLLSLPMQHAVAWGELICGLALVAGLLTQLVALGVIVIQAGAVMYVTWPFDFIHSSFTREGLNFTKVGYEYNFALIIMAFAVMVLGPGVLSVDELVWSLFRRPAGRRKAPAEGGLAEAPAAAPSAGVQEWPQQIQSQRP
jgi:uncharacterized membrane protein YphA (DoxX/SURF4 family)